MSNTKPLDKDLILEYRREVVDAINENKYGVDTLTTAGLIDYILLALIQPEKVTLVDRVLYYIFSQDPGIYVSAPDIYEGISSTSQQVSPQLMKLREEGIINDDDAKVEGKMLAYKITDRKKAIDKLQFIVEAISNNVEKINYPHIKAALMQGMLLVQRGYTGEKNPRSIPDMYFTLYNFHNGVLKDFLEKKSYMTRYSMLLHIALLPGINHCEFDRFIGKCSKNIVHIENYMYEKELIERRESSKVKRNTPDGLYLTEKGKDILVQGIRDCNKDFEKGMNDAECAEDIIEGLKLLSDIATSLLKQTYVQ